MHSRRNALRGTAVFLIKEVTFGRSEATEMVSDPTDWNQSLKDLLTGTSARMTEDTSREVVQQNLL